MTNGERRHALNKARAEALRHATWAEELSEDYQSNPKLWSAHLRMASMWAAVGDVLKDGDPDHDSSDGHSSIDGTTYR